MVDELDLAIRDLDVLRARLEALRAKPLEINPILTVEEIQERFKVGRAAILAAEGRKELKVTRGPRNRIQVRLRELERWMDAERPALCDDDDAERARQLRAWAGGAK